MQKALGTFGLSALDRLYSFMIVKELQNVSAWILTSFPHSRILFLCSSISVWNVFQAWHSLRQTSRRLPRPSRKCYMCVCIYSLYQLLTSLNFSLSIDVLNDFPFQCIVLVLMFLQGQGLEPITEFPRDPKVGHHHLSNHCRPITIIIIRFTRKFK